MTEKTFKGLTTEKFPNLTETVNSDPSSSMNPRQKKYDENHTTMSYNPIAENQRYERKS